MPVGTETSTFEAIRRMERYADWIDRNGNFTTDETLVGVIRSGLDVTASTSASSQRVSPLVVSGGTALVRRFPYTLRGPNPFDPQFNGFDATLSIPVPTPTTGTTGHRLVLRADWASRTVRIALKFSPDGTVAIPALTQADGSVWEERLATLTITTSGVIETLSATRDPLVVTSATPLNYGSQKPSLVSRVGGSSDIWTIPGTTSYRPIGASLTTGVWSWAGSAASSGSIAMALPSGTALGAIPFVSTSDPAVVAAGTVSGTTLTITWQTTDNTTRTNVTLMWLLVGPE